MTKRMRVFLSVFSIVFLSASWLVAAWTTSDSDIVAGVLRSEDDRGWYAVDDKDHTPINIHSVTIYDGLIIVTFSKRFEVINTFIAVPDETFAANGYIFGSTVNKTRAKILVSKIEEGKAVPVDASRIRSKLGNVWVYGIFGG